MDESVKGLDNIHCGISYRYLDFRLPIHLGFHHDVRHFAFFHMLCSTLREFRPYPYTHS